MKSKNKIIIQIKVQTKVIMNLTTNNEEKGKSEEITVLQIIHLLPTRAKMNREVVPKVKTKAMKTPTKKEKMMIMTMTIMVNNKAMWRERPSTNVAITTIVRTAISTTIQSFSKSLMNMITPVNSKARTESTVPLTTSVW